MQYSQISRRPFRRSAGVSKPRFRVKIVCFRKETLKSPGWPRIIPTSIWCKKSAIQADFDAARGDFSTEILKKMHYGQISRRPFRRSAGVSERNLCENMFFSEQNLAAPGMA